jgi:hypothetical protein
MKIESLKIVTVYQPVTQDNDGMNRPTSVYFTTREEAKKMCNGWGAPPEPLERQAVLINGTKIRVLEDGPDLRLHSTKEDYEREVALSKLSEKEKKLLGIS